MTIKTHPPLVNTILPPTGKPAMDEMQILTTRVDKLENKISDDIEKIFVKLEALALAAAARRECPSPGLCLALQTRMNEFDSEKRDLTKELLSIQKWQAGIMASLVLLGVIITFFGPTIRHMLGIQH